MAKLDTRKWLSFDHAELTFMTAFAVSIVAAAMGCGRSTMLKSRPAFNQAQSAFAEAGLPGTHAIDSGFLTNNGGNGTVTYYWQWTPSSVAAGVGSHFQVFLCPSASSPCNQNWHVDIQCAVLDSNHYSCNTATQSSGENSIFGIVTANADNGDIDTSSGTAYFGYDDPVLNSSNWPTSQIAVIRQLQ